MYAYMCTQVIYNTYTANTVSNLPDYAVVGKANIIRSTTTKPHSIYVTSATAAVVKTMHLIRMRGKKKLTS